MQKIIWLILLVFTLLFADSLLAQSLDLVMNNEKMEALLRSEVEEIEGETGNWQLIYGGRLLLILTDEANNRMRIFSPIVEESKIEGDQLKKMLEANFHSALDAKFSIYNEYVISVYTHPLKELHKDQFIDAMRQVVILADNFGGSYSSTGLIFGSGFEKEKTEEEKKKEELILNKKPKKD